MSPIHHGHKGHKIRKPKVHAKVHLKKKPKHHHAHHTHHSHKKKH